MTKIGHDIQDKVFSLNLKIAKKFSKSGYRKPRWKPKRPTYSDLQDKWVIIEFDVLTFALPILGIVWEFDDDVLEIRYVVDLTTLELKGTISYNFKAIKEIYILESPETTSANELIYEVARDKLDKSIISDIAFYSQLIMKLKNRIRNQRIAELVNFLGDKIKQAEEMADESEILGEEITHTKSKTQEERQKFEESDSVKRWLDVVEQETRDIERMSIEEIQKEAHVIAEKSYDDMLKMFVYWIDVLSEMRNDNVDEFIRLLYYDVINMNR